MVSLPSHSVVYRRNPENRVKKAGCPYDKVYERVGMGGDCKHERLKVFGNGFDQVSFPPSRVSLLFPCAKVSFDDMTLVRLTRFRRSVFCE